MCDAFTKMDLEQVLRELSPSEDHDSGDLGKAVGRMEDDSIGTVLDALEDARRALDEDDPDGETVLAAMDFVVRAIEVAEESRTSMTERADALWSAYNEVAEKDRTEIDPDDLISELAFRGYEIVKVKRNVTPIRRATVAKTRRAKLRAVG